MFVLHTINAMAKVAVAEYLAGDCRSLFDMTYLTNNNDRLHLLDILVVQSVGEQEEKADNDESHSKADNEEDKLLVTLYSVFYIQSHSVLSSRNITINYKNPYYNEVYHALMTKFVVNAH